MKVAAVVTLLTTIAMGASLGNERRGLNDLCAPLETPACCETVVAGVVGLTCDSPSPAPKDISAFEKTCAESGMGANCCTAVVDGTGVACNPTS